MFEALWLSTAVIFVAEGFGVARHPLMYNDFVLLGPAADPAGVAGGTDIVAAPFNTASA